MICQECGMEIEGNEYHPYAFCVLVKAGLNPLSVVLEAASQLIPAEAEQPAEPDADGEVEETC